MSDAATAPSRSGAAAFSGRSVLALVLVGLVAFAALAVLSAYAPELRDGNDGRAHALSKSAIGYAGAPILMQKLGAPAVVRRTRGGDLGNAVLVLTPEAGTAPTELKRFPKAFRTLIVLPKWIVTEDPLRRGFVKKVDVLPDGSGPQTLLGPWSKTSRLAHAGPGAQALRGAGGPFAPGTYLPVRVDALQSISGDGWVPALIDAQGRAVLAYARRQPDVWVLADPDLLNNHGLGRLDNARAGVAILDAARGGENSVVFDVTLNGFARGRGLGRTMLEPPWLAATLCAVAAAILMGLHGLARFGQPQRQGRAIALGATALVNNSADLIRMARKEAELAGPYAALVRAQVLKAAGGHLEEHWLDDLAARRGAAAPADLAAEAEQTKTRDELMAVARKLYDWRGEMTRERR